MKMQRFYDQIFTGIEIININIWFVFSAYIDCVVILKASVKPVNYWNILAELLSCIHKGLPVVLSCTLIIEMDL